MSDFSPREAPRRASLTENDVGGEWGRHRGREIQLNIRLPEDEAARFKRLCIDVERLEKISQAELLHRMMDVYEKHLGRK